ncbi:DUF3891 family protein [Salinibaculum salinum]|uniref:DUF3891 family protein n=1 Tax=Salinibaculum salinum TaxID=3131996 RepID=UPI0030EC9490
MLVAETETAYRFVTQPAHAALAGRLARMWVREADTTDPEVAMAVYNHDNGWWAHDRCPHLTDDGTPAGVGDVPPETWVEFYESGIDSVVQLDPYAGLLASMHGSGLRRERYGLTDGPPSDHPAYDEFVDREERRQRQLASELPAGRLSSADENALSTLHETGTVDDSESRLWRAYRLLETWDICSIALCTATAGATTEIPTAPAADVLVEAVDDATVTVVPYPFETSPLTVQVPTRTVDKESFDTESALCREYYRTREEFRSITVKSP